MSQFLRPFSIGLLAPALCSFALLAPADEPWNRFRGPNGSGISDAKTIPTTWTDADYNWQVDLPGSGASSPVVWDGKLFITTADEQSLERSLRCYATQDGKLLWSRSEPFEKDKKHVHNTYASNTPAVDAERVYTVWQSHVSSQLLAFDHAGKELWRFELGPFQSGHGGGVSPIVVDGLVALGNLHEGKSFLLGVDAATGRERWRIARDSFKATYSTPCVLKDSSGQCQLIFTSWKYGFTCVDPKSGKILWEKDVFEPGDGEEKRSIGSPVVSDGAVYGTCGFVGGKRMLVGLKPTGDSPASNAQELFRLERGANHMPTTLACQGRVYSWTDAGVVQCLDGQTGKSVWQRRVGGNYSCSPLWIDGKIYCISEKGEVVVLAAADEFQELARVKLDSGASGTPAISDGVMYFRTATRLYSLGGKK